MKPLGIAWGLFLALLAGGALWLFAGGGGEVAVFALPATAPQASPDKAGGANGTRSPDKAGDTSETPSPDKAGGVNETPSPDKVGGGRAATDSAPDPGLIEQGRDGPLPRIGRDGRKPWRVYARAASTIGARPRIAVIIRNLGLDKRISETAIAGLPAAVTLALSPYGRGLASLARAARARGHEILIAMPMDSADPARDPGPYALLSGNSAAENVARLRWILSRVTGYVGAISEMGSRFTTNIGALRPVLTELRDRGLMFVDGRTARGSIATRLADNLKLPRALVDRAIDNEMTVKAIDGRLREIERIARRNGVAVASARPHPLSLARIAIWLSGLDAKGLALVPITAVVDRQKNR